MKKSQKDFTTYNIIHYLTSPIEYFHALGGVCDSVLTTKLGSSLTGKYNHDLYL